jgi:NodT family efflux transporter outer membrane factor (OMF) lipoprotein
LARWWLRFKDPLLSKLVVQALQANTTVRTAQSALQQARATRDVKAANLFPTVGASVSSQSSQTAGSDASNTFKTGFDASWEPDVFGAKRSARDATEAEANAAETHLGDVQISIAAEVAQTYIELRGLQARLAIARNNLVSQNETLQITQWRVQAGLASSLDLEQARTASALTSAQIPSLDIAAVQTQNSLSILTGQAPGALQAVLDATPPSLQAPADLALSIPAHTLRQRPDVRTAEFRISAALSRVSQAEAARYPGFQISGFLGLSSLSTGGISTALAATNSLLASVAVPLFDGGAARAEIRAQEAALEQSRIAYEATVLTALKDVEDALKALQGDRERLEWLQVAAQAAANADLLARQRYGSGLIDFRSVLETQRTLLSTQDSVESTRVSLISDHVRLYKALGGGWVAATATDRL